MDDVSRWVDIVLLVALSSLVTVVPGVILAVDHRRGRRDPGYRDSDPYGSQDEDD